MKKLLGAAGTLALAVALMTGTADARPQTLVFKVGRVYTSETPATTTTVPPAPAPK